MEYFFASILVVEMNFNGCVSLIWCSATPVGSCNIYISKKSTLSILLCDSFLHGPGLNNFVTCGCVFCPYSWKMMEVNYNVEILSYILSFVKRARHGTRRFQVFMQCC